MLSDCECGREPGVGIAALLTANAGGSPAVGLADCERGKEPDVELSDFDMPEGARRRVIRLRTRDGARHKDSRSSRL